MYNDCATGPDFRGTVSKLMGCTVYMWLFWGPLEDNFGGRLLRIIIFPHLSYPQLVLCTFLSLSFAMNVGKFWTTQNTSLHYLLQNHIYDFVLRHLIPNWAPWPGCRFLEVWEIVGVWRTTWSKNFIFRYIVVEMSNYHSSIVAVV